MKRNEMLQFLHKIAEGISSMFGQNCEVLILDLDQPDHAILEIFNGHVTGRKVGDSLTVLGLKRMKQGKIGEDLVNYEVHTDDGRMLKSSSFYVSGKGFNFAFCINFDYTKLYMVNSAIESLIKTSQQIDEKFLSNSGEKVLDEMFNDAIKYVGIPVAHMKKEDRIKAVKYLDEHGAFLYQRGIQIIADRLNISRYSIYNYMKVLERSAE